jgi:hypothetical protein
VAALLLRVPPAGCGCSLAGLACPRHPGSKRESERGGWQRACVERDHERVKSLASPFGDRGRVRARVSVATADRVRLLLNPWMPAHPGIMSKVYAVCYGGRQDAYKVTSKGCGQGMSSVTGGSHTAMQKLRIVTCGVSGGRSLTRPFRDAHRFPSP